MIQFPDSPTVNQLFTAANKTWAWNGYAWDLVVQEIEIPDIDSSRWEEDEGLDSNGYLKVSNIRPKESKKVHVDHIDRLVRSSQILHGYIYNIPAVEESFNEEGFIAGFRVPSVSDWDTLEAYLGSTHAGEKIKSTEMWPSSDQEEMRNETGMSVFPSGQRSTSGKFTGMLTTATFSCADPLVFKILTDWSNIIEGTIPVGPYYPGYSIRLVKNIESDLPDGSIVESVEDYDGNSYTVIKIGTQAWLGYNLATTHYANGTPIQHVPETEDWVADASPKYCAYDNNMENAIVSIPGKLHQVAVTGDYNDLENLPDVPEGYLGFSIANSEGEEQFEVGSEDSVRFEGTGDTSVSYDSVNRKIIINSIQGSGSGSDVTSFNSRTGAVVSQLGDYTTSMVSEGTNLYFTSPRVLGTVVDNLPIANAVIVNNDTVLQALGKAQGQLNNRVISTRTIGITGTTDVIDVIGGVQNLSANRVWSINLTPTGIAGGSYTKLTVDLYGRAQAGGQLTESDIPSLSASKVVAGVFNIARIPTGTTASTVALGNHAHTFASLTSKPTTLAGYGIADAAPLSHVGSTGTSHGIVTTTVNGFMSSTDKVKLNGIAAGAQANVATNIGQGTRTATTVPLTSSTGTGTTLPAVTTSLAGLMTAADKTKLNGIATGAQVNVATNIGQGTRTATTIPLTSSTGTGTTLPAATTSLAGLMSSTDKTAVSNLGTIASKGFWKGTKAQYDAIATKNANTIYFVTE